MVNKPKEKGTAAETRVVRAFLAAGVSARRVALKGKYDEGDVHVDGHRGPDDIYALEVKAGRQTISVSRKQREDWLSQARVEAAACGREGYLVIAKHRASVGDYHVWSCDGHLFWYLDEFIEWIREGR